MPSVFHPKLNKNVVGALCKRCKTPFLSNTSGNLKRHLKSHHKDVWEEIEGNTTNK